MMILARSALNRFGGILIVVLLTCTCTLSQTKSGPVDPGVRSGPAGAGGPLGNLTADETTFFKDGQGRFAEIEVVKEIGRASCRERVLRLV